MKQKKYMDIERLKPVFVHGFQQGDHIIVQEKIDGANFSIAYDTETNSIKAFSRQKELNEQNDLRGAYKWSQMLDVDIVKEVLGGNRVLFMEWLVKHTVPYPPECYNKAYCYDIYDKEINEYLPQDAVKKAVKALNLAYVPVFYDGEFTSWDDLKQIVGKTNLGGEYGEGIIVKNQTKLNNANTRLPFYVKIVCDTFCETKAHRQSKPLNEEKIREAERINALTETIVTKARVVKLLHKLVDDGIIPEDWDESSMSVIAKNIGKNTYTDCLKEEPETVSEIGPSFGRVANRIAMSIIREELRNKMKV